MFPISIICLAISDSVSAKKDNVHVNSPSHAVMVDLPIEGGAGTHTSMTGVEVDFVIDTHNVSDINATEGKCALHIFMLFIYVSVVSYIHFLT